MNNKKQSKTAYRKSLKEHEELSMLKPDKDKKNYQAKDTYDRNQKNNHLPDKDIQSTSGSEDMKNTNAEKTFKRISNKYLSSGLSPANDLSSGGITHILQNIGKNSLSIALRNAFISSLVWFACELGFIVKSYANSSMPSFYDFAIRTEAIIFFSAITFIPILLFFRFL
ncbi:chemotaxis sensory transducer [Candidatus Liberibacter solanacearum CLso-ZC1]|uniref:Chemotaxis sensory transducer n=1 Tax=Liberibacter solanacearum (strain CLso-ZC1) TaxID=658172 RepID=E4UBC2_LIBSC|nr:hypothetical protein [Candidatus Liberibacter solanacearum]ADR52601.1 chemotaxis sensory transducer [Candidatus Liberibacter solanacearum CLso-ZC1]